MTASLGPREGESATGVASDAQIPIKPEKENVEPAEKKKVTNGFLVSLSGELMAASSPL
jgi:ATP-binding cassette subfamily B (MDR/TAP) protein 1